MPLAVSVNTIPLDERTARALELCAEFRFVVDKLKTFAGEQAGNDEWSMYQSVREIASKGIIEAAQQAARRTNPVPQF